MTSGSHHKGHPSLPVYSGPSEQHFFVQIRASWTVRLAMSSTGCCRRLG